MRPAINFLNGIGVVVAENGSKGPEDGIGSQFGRPAPDAYESQ